MSGRHFKFLWPAVIIFIVLLIFLFSQSTIFKTAELALSLKKQNLLVGFQNSAELRPTGGFWGSFGIWKINKHAFDSKFYFETNPYKKDNPLLLTSSESLPKPLEQTYAGRTQSFVNANWQINFPDAAKNLQWYLAQGWGEQTDGVVAISSLFLIDLLKQTGPITLNDGSEISADNFTQILSDKINEEYWQNPENLIINEPKTILKDLAPQILTRLQTLGIIKLSRFLSGQIRQGHITTFFNNTKQQNLAKKLNIIGEIKKTSSDYLQINNANINGGKSSLNINQAVDYQINLKSEKPKSSLKIRRTLNNDWPNILNRNYTRVMVPLGSSLTSAKIDNQDITSDIDITSENGYSLFGFWFSVGPGETKTAELTYILPFEKFSAKRYNLTYQKQPGTAPDGLSININAVEYYRDVFDKISKIFFY